MADREWSEDRLDAVVEELRDRRADRLELAEVLHALGRAKHRRRERTARARQRRIAPDALVQIEPPMGRAEALEGALVLRATHRVVAEDAALGRKRVERRARGEARDDLD